MTEILFHPLADLFPLLRDKEFDELVADIKANGLRDPIVLLEDLILDGRNRYRACLAAGISNIRFEMFPADSDPLSFVFSKNIHRRHLTVGQRAYVMAEYETLRHGGPRKTDEQDANLRLETAPDVEPETRANLAEKGHVSERSIASAAVVRDHGVDDLKTAVKQGDIAISAAEQIARLPEQEQPQALAKALPHGHRAIMGSRQEPDDSLDYFPTPPWATRALCEHVLPRFANAQSSMAWEPACGEGHMAEALGEYFASVIATDVHEYGYGRTFDFLEHQGAYDADWIITNPPFSDKSETFVLRAMDQARVGVAMFLRLQWLESVGRYERIFQPHPPVMIAQFAERVPLHKGRWEPEGATATAYLWIVWMKHHPKQWKNTEFFWIPPGQRSALTRPGDAVRFTAHPVTKRDSPSPHDPVTGEIPDSGSGTESMSGDAATDQLETAP